MFKFITYNDTQNFTDIFDQLFEYLSLNKNLILIFDEVHNLFNSIVNKSNKAINIYNKIMEKKNI